MYKCLALLLESLEYIASLFAKEISSNFNEMDRGDARITNIFASSVGPASILIWETQNPPIRILNLP